MNFDSEEKTNEFFYLFGQLHAHLATGEVIDLMDVQYRLWHLWDGPDKGYSGEVLHSVDAVMSIIIADPDLKVTELLSIAGTILAKYQPQKIRNPGPDFVSLLATGLCFATLSMQREKIYALKL